MEAEQSLEQVRQDVTDLTQHPQIGLLRLQSEYEVSKDMSQRRICEVLQLPEYFLRSFVEIPPLDNFRDHLLPSATEPSSRILQDVYGQMKRNCMSRTTPTRVDSSTYLVWSSLPADAMPRALPHLEGHFASFEHRFAIAHASMQGMYSKLRGLVQPLEQPENPPRGIFRTMGFDQLRDAQLNWRELKEQWAAQLRL